MKTLSIFSTAALFAAISVGLAPSVDAQEPATPGLPAAPRHTPENLVVTAETQGFLEWTRIMREAGLEPQLVDRPHTVFVARDEAYLEVPMATREAWAADPARQRAAVRYSIVEGRLTADELRQRESVTTIDGQTLPVRVEGDRIFVGDAMIEEADIDAGTGIIHRTNFVLLPPDPAPAPMPQPEPAPLPQPEPAPLPPAEPAQPLEPAPDPALDPLPPAEPVRKDP